MNLDVIDAKSLFSDLISVFYKAKDSDDIIKQLDQKAIKLLIDNSKELKIPSYILAILLKYYNDDYTKKVFLDDKSMRFNYKEIDMIVESISDDYKKQLLNLYNYNFDNSLIASVFIHIDDCEYKNNILLKYRSNITKDYIMFEMLKSMSFDYQKLIIDNYESYNLSNVDVISLLLTIDDDYAYQKLDYYYRNGYLGSALKKEVKLDSTLTFGIEIEYSGNNSDQVVGSVFGKGWKGHYDSSLDRGYELSSPVMISSAGYENQIYKTCMALEKNRFKISENCAGHIHMGFDYFNNDISYIKTMLNMYKKTERLFYLITNKVNELPRPGIVVHVNTLVDKIKAKESEGLVDFDKLNTVEEFKELIRDIQDSKAYSINFLNIGLDDKNTIEFRMPNGTLDPNVWIENINLIGGFIMASKKITDLEKQSFNSLSSYDKEYLAKYQLLISNDLPEEERLELLLGLTIDEEDRDIYRNRYYINNNILEIDSEVENFIDDTGKPKKPILLRRPDFY